MLQLVRSTPCETYPIHRNIPYFFWSRTGLYLSTREALQPPFNGGRESIGRRLPRLAYSPYISYSSHHGAPKCHKPTNNLVPSTLMILVWSLSWSSRSLSGTCGKHYLTKMDTYLVRFASFREDALLHAILLFTIRISSYTIHGN